MDILFEFHPWVHKFSRNRIWSLWIKSNLWLNNSHLTWWFSSCLQQQIQIQQECSCCNRKDLCLECRPLQNVYRFHLLLDNGFVKIIFNLDRGSKWSCPRHGLSPPHRFKNVRLMIFSFNMVDYLMFFLMLSTLNLTVMLRGPFHLLFGFSCGY